jgi:SAM-dependent methyltransferase
MRAFERWLSGGSLRSRLHLWGMGPLGTFFVNSPLFRLPENLQLDPSLHVLEIGTGRGSLLRMLDQRVQFDIAPAGIDESPSVLQQARRDEASTERPPRLARATSTELPFADGSFHLILCGHAIGHLPDDELLTTLREFRRVLAPGGLALIWDFTPSGRRVLDGWFRRLLFIGSRAQQMRSTVALLQSAELAGFEFFRDADLRPFLLPPVPRASVLIGVPPDEAAPDPTGSREA